MMIDRSGIPGRRWSARLAIATMLATSVVAAAAPPDQPLPAPFYTFDQESPTVQSGFFSAADILVVGFPRPTPVVDGPTLGLFSTSDDIDSLAAGGIAMPPSQSFALLFSVDRDTLGVEPPDPALLALGTPFNALDQAWRGHAAGDQFLALSLFRGDGVYEHRSSNNTLTRNNFNEGGTSFSGDPPTHAQDYAGNVPEDNVNGQSGTATKARIDGSLFFSLTRESPSLTILPGGNSPSGAHVFFNASPDPNDPAPTQLYAHYLDLGLDQFDDIDALIVFDMNLNGSYDGGDQILFSLTADSPSLATIPGASQSGAAADVFVVTPGAMPAVFSLASDFGLGEFSDNVTALDFALCQDGVNCATRAGIRSEPGDLNCDHVIDFGDINPFVTALVEGESAYVAHFPYCNWWNADCNTDAMIDFDDINPFVVLVVSPPEPAAEE